MTPSRLLQYDRWLEATSVWAWVSSSGSKSDSEASRSSLLALAAAAILSSAFPLACKHTVGVLKVITTIVQGKGWAARIWLLHEGIPGVRCGYGALWPTCFDTDAPRYHSRPRGVQVEQQELLSPNPESHRPRTFLAGVGTLDADLAADACGCLPLAGSFLREGAASRAAAAACAPSGSCALASAHALRRASLISSMVTFRLPAPGLQAHQARPTHAGIMKQSFTSQCETLDRPEAAS